VSDLLEGTSAVDVHCHGWRSDEVAALPQRGFLDRITMLGMCLVSSGLEDEGLREILELTTDTSPIAVAMADRLGAILGCEPTRDGLAAARAAALAEGRDYVLPDDLKSLAGPVLAHRLIPSSPVEALTRSRGDVERVLADIIDRLPAPG